MQAFDVLIVPSEWEAFGIVSIEAQAAGVPVVAFDVDGLRESLSDGVTGVLVPHRDTLAMAEAVAELLADPARRTAMGAAGVQLVAERFSAEGMVSQLAQIYGRLAGGK
jgi:type III pantothenate kinase